MCGFDPDGRLCLVSSMSQEKLHSGDDGLLRMPGPLGDRDRDLTKGWYTKDRRKSKKFGVLSDC